MVKVYFGGAGDISRWRNELTAILPSKATNKNDADAFVYVITPQSDDVDTVVELTESSILHPDKTVACFLQYYAGEAFGTFKWRALRKAREIVMSHGAKCCNTLQEISEYISTSWN